MIHFGAIKTMRTLYGTPLKFVGRTAHADYVFSRDLPESCDDGTILVLSRSEFVCETDEDWRTLSIKGPLMRPRPGLVPDIFTPSALEDYIYDPQN
ncbi:MAG: hypothetical protein ACYDBH_12340 [Acidobacteriaceae bacterium]